MSDEKRTVKIQFAPEQKSPTLDIGHGEYSRKFDVKDQPFECDEEEARMLLRMPEGFFVAAVEKKEADKLSALPTAGKIGGAPAPVE
jgi:hypothetical protein